MYNSKSLLKRFAPGGVTGDCPPGPNGEKQIKLPNGQCGTFADLQRMVAIAGLNRALASDRMVLTGNLSKTQNVIPASRNAASIARSDNTSIQRKPVLNPRTGKREVAPRSDATFSQQWSQPLAREVDPQFVERENIAMGLTAAPFLAPIVGSGLAAAGFTPSVVGAALNTPILGTAGLTGNNLLWGTGAYLSGRELINPNSATRISATQAIKNPTFSNVAGAIGNAGMTALGFYGLPVKSGLLSLGDDFTRAGQYLTTQTPLRNVYKLNPLALKENPNILLHRVQKPGQTEQYIIESFGKTQGASSEPGWGRAFSSDPSDMYYYTQPSIKKTRGYTEDPEILRLTIPKTQLEQFSVENFNATRRAQGQSIYGSNRPTSEYILPIEDIIEAEKFGLEDVDRLMQEYKKFNTPNWLRGYKKEVPKRMSGFSYPSFKSMTGNPEYIDQEYLAGLIKRETDWLRSPEYVKRKMAATGKSEQAIRKESEKIINNINNTSIEYTGKAEDWASGLYSPGKNPKISIFNSNVDYPYYEGVLRHEVGHAFSEMGNPGDELISFFKNEGYRNYPKVNLNKTVKDKISNIFGYNWANLAPEQQVTGRRMMDIIEETQGLKRGTELSEDNVKKLITHLKSDKFNIADNDVIEVMSKFKRKFGKDYSKQLTDFLNKAYVIPAGIVGAAAIEQKKKGGELKQFAPGGFLTTEEIERLRKSEGIPLPKKFGGKIKTLR